MLIQSHNCGTQLDSAAGAPMRSIWVLLALLSRLVSRLGTRCLRRRYQVGITFRTLHRNCPDEWTKLLIVVELHGAIGKRHRCRQYGVAGLLQPLVLLVQIIHNGQQCLRQRNTLLLYGRLQAQLLMCIQQIQRRYVRIQHQSSWMQRLILVHLQLHQAVALEASVETLSLQRRGPFAVQRHNLNAIAVLPVAGQPTLWRDVYSRGRTHVRIGQMLVGVPEEVHGIHQARHVRCAAAYVRQHARGQLHGQMGHPGYGAYVQHLRGLRHRDTRVHHLDGGAVLVHAAAQRVPLMRGARPWSLLSRGGGSGMR